MSLSFCNRVLNGDTWTRCFGENEWIDYVYTPVICLLGRAVALELMCGNELVNFTRKIPDGVCSLLKMFILDVRV